jgi:uncharacterized membrane protein YeaQ/YmgE (transglycosylase-associated protein family)
MLELLISLIAGAAGGNIAGMVAKSINQGAVINSIAGILGGGLGGQIFAMLFGGAPATGVDLDAVVTQIAGGGLGGGVLLFIVSLVRAMMNKAG